MSSVGDVANAQAADASAEDHQADDEDLLAAVLVTQDAPGEQQRREDEDVGVDGPDELALVGGQVALDGRERDVEDRVVEDHDEQARDEHAEDRPASRVSGCRRSAIRLGAERWPGRSSGPSGVRTESVLAERMSIGTIPYAILFRDASVPVHGARGTLLVPREPYPRFWPVRALAWRCSPFRTGTRRGPRDDKGNPMAQQALYGGASTRRVTVRDLADAKVDGERWPMLTSYDALTAGLFDAAGIPVLLVGDSAVDGRLRARLDAPGDRRRDDARWCAAVVRGTSRALVVADLPFGSYQSSPEQALDTAARFIKEAGAHAVKLEGGARVLPQVEALVAAGVPVMGHLGPHAAVRQRLRRLPRAGPRRVRRPAAAATPRPCSTPARSPSCSRSSPRTSPPRSPRCSRSRRSASAPAPAATRRSSSGRTSPASPRDRARSSSSATPTCARSSTGAVQAVGRRGRRRHLPRRGAHLPLT